MQLMYGGDIVAPPGNQVANSEHKHLPVASGVPSLLDKNSAEVEVLLSSGLLSVYENEFRTTSIATHHCIDDTERTSGTISAG